MHLTFEQRQQILEFSNYVTDISQSILQHGGLIEKYVRPACGMIIFANDKIRADVEQSASHPGVAEIELAGNALVASTTVQQILEDADNEQEVLENMRG